MYFPALTLEMVNRPLTLVVTPLINALSFAASSFTVASIRGSPVSSMTFPFMSAAVTAAAQNTVKSKAMSIRRILNQYK